MREIRLQVWCDEHHQANGEYVEATETRLVNVPGKGMVRLDLCEQSDKELFGPLHDLFAERNVAPVKVGSETKLSQPVKHVETKEVCPLCGSACTDRHILLKHIKVVHVAADVRHKSTQPKRCPDCHVRNDDARAMAAHRRTQHGFDALEGILAIAKAHPAEKVTA